MADDERDLEWHVCSISALREAVDALRARAEKAERLLAEARVLAQRMIAAARSGDDLNLLRFADDVVRRVLAHEEEKP